jgi:sugar phosphate isomerase/epimerase
MIWGYAGCWYHEFTKDYGSDDKLMCKMRFAAERGLQSTGVSVHELEHSSPQRLDQIGAFVAEHDMHLTLGAGYDWIHCAEDEILPAAQQVIDQIERFKDLVRARIVTLHGGGAHRFMRDPSLAFQLERMHRGFAPIAAACHQMGLRCGRENHGDYYCSDLAQLCRETPHMGIYLDTGNTYLIGERPIPAFHDAAPFVIGTHFKDHYVYPVGKTLSFQITGATLGEGDVGLRECYDILMAECPHPEELVMDIEFVKAPDDDPLEGLERSLGFVRSLPRPEPITAV